MNLKYFFLLLAFSAASTLLKSQNNIAVVNKIQGFYIFNDSQPLAEYDVIGEVSTNGHNDADIKNFGGQYQAVRDYLVKSARLANYSADGLILSLINGGTDKAVIIKFKEDASNKNHAKVSQFQGLYIFSDCEPLKQSKYLGTIKARSNVFNAQYSPLRDRLIKKSKSDYADANALILKLVVGGTDTGDAVKVD